MGANRTQRLSQSSCEAMNPLAPPSFLIGLIGAGIQASRSPAMHEREGAAHGFRYWYRLIDTDVLRLGPEALPQLLASAEQMGFSGLNITHPFKQAVIEHLTELSDDARALGAVNTVLLRDGKRIGHNTDWSGFAAGFQRGLPEAEIDRVTLLGAGGAGAAVAHALLTLGAGHLDVFDVDGARASRLAANLARHFSDARVTAVTDLRSSVELAQGLVHATPTGMKAHPGLPLPADWLRPELWVAEIVYFPLETALLQAARSIGCRTLDGGGMAVFQAVDAFRLFTGATPDPQRMLDHFAAMMAP